MWVRTTKSSDQDELRIPKMIEDINVFYHVSFPVYYHLNPGQLKQQLLSMTCCRIFVYKPGFKICKKYNVRNLHSVHLFFSGACGTPQVTGHPECHASVSCLEVRSSAATMVSMEGESGSLEDKKALGVNGQSKHLVEMAGQALLNSAEAKLFPEVKPGRGEVVQQDAADASSEKTLLDCDSSDDNPAKVARHQIESLEREQERITKNALRDINNTTGNDAGNAAEEKPCEPLSAVQSPSASSLEKMNELTPNGFGPHEDPTNTEPCLQMQNIPHSESSNSSSPVFITSGVTPNENSSSCTRNFEISESKELSAENHDTSDACIDSVNQVKAALPCQTPTKESASDRSTSPSEECKVANSQHGEPTGQCESSECQYVVHIQNSVAEQELRSNANKVELKEGQDGDVGTLPEKCSAGNAVTGTKFSAY